MRLSDQGPMATWVMFLAPSIMSISLDPNFLEFSNSRAMGTD